MVDLRPNPFFLEDEDIRWVESTLASMTLDEKIGQLFCPISFTEDQGYLKMGLIDKHIGGTMYRPGKGENIQEAHRFLQNNSKIPMLLAANLEEGGTGIAAEGTSLGKEMQVAATGKKEFAYRLGKTACSEGAAVGINWSFAPIVDIDLNFRNPITNVRTFGNNADTVLEFATEYMRGAKEGGVAVSIKHFPGDGVDERDQHIVTTVNSLSCEEWDKSYGKIYKGLIDQGALTVMVGHIAMPAYQHAINPEFGNRLVPATLSSELLKGLLRERLGFNGMIVSDATPMVGFTSAMDRETAVPYSVASGCDMFLFNKELDEDISFMKKGLEKGILTMERLEEAITRILATKASLELHKKQKEGTLVPEKSALSVLNCTEHAAWAKECADQSITLVKDTQKLLPVGPDKYKRVFLVMAGESPNNERVLNSFSEKLSKEGFEVSVFEPPLPMAKQDNVTEFKSKYDLVIYIGNVENASNKTVNRISWHTFFGSGNHCPWFVHEVPTMFISVANPYHLLDVAMIKTYINCYNNSEYCIDAVMEKIMGRSEFKGISPIDPFCGRWDTTL